MKLNPKCLIDPKQDKQKTYITSQNLAHSAKGFILPCCWCDIPEPEKDEQIKKLFNKKLHLDNNDTIEDIILSDEWFNFFSTLTDDTSNASSVCKKYCSVGDNKTVVVKKVIVDNKEILK
ncbi:MAG: hypothetical protein CMO44_13765 [Verrucomicrobiales bacterium]|nr:hypothetical protein [Verrucomicrobiales bacterium]|tara:strand:+ start:4523 stop:4882 length:360 start_codon:yes stop_codon:yes gene_type:complete